MQDMRKWVEPTMGGGVQCDIVEIDARINDWAFIKTLYNTAGQQTHKTTQYGTLSECQTFFNQYDGTI